MSRLFKFTLAVVTLAWTAQAFADDAYYYLPLEGLNITEGSIPNRDEPIREG